MCVYCERQEPRPELLALSRPGDSLPSSLWLANHTGKIDESDIDWAIKTVSDLKHGRVNG